MKTVWIVLGTSVGVVLLLFTGLFFATALGEKHHKELPRHGMVAHCSDEVSDIDINLVLEEAIPPPPEKVVQKVRIENINIFKTTIINQPAVCEKPVEQITEEPLVQDSLRTYNNRSSGSYSIHYISGGGSSFSYDFNTSNGGQTSNKKVHGPNPKGCGLNTQGCRR